MINQKEMGQDSEEEVFLPDYMKDVGPANYYYGTLKYDKRTNKWVIKGEPCVCQMAKRLFPGCDTKRRGTARFTANKRIIGDLNWLMMRYPLEIKNRDKWDRDIEEARQYVLKREWSNKYPLKAEVPKLTFNGELMEFQKEGLGFLLRNNRALLADEMGLGKTVQALAYLASINSYPVLLVVPPHLVRYWQREIDRFLRLPPVEKNDEGISLAGNPDNNFCAEATCLEGMKLDGMEKEFNAWGKNSFDSDMKENPEADVIKSEIDGIKSPGKDGGNAPKVHVIKGIKPYRLPEAHIYIIHYLLLRGWKNVLPEAGFQTVIFDEIQELRHAGTEKYSSASLIADNCKNVIGLSGTPIYNRGGEIWNVMNILDSHCLGDWDSFTREWCYGYGNGVVINPTLLGEHLRREGLLFRRTKDAVLEELPPKRRLVQEIDSDEGIYENLIQSAVEKVKKLDMLEEGFEKESLILQISQEERQATGVAKAPYVCAFVKALLEAEEKVLLFAHHHSVMDIYRKELKHFKPVFITGRENDKQKDAAVNAFMEGRTNICCVSLRAAAGLNLQRASCIVFGELDWSPAVHSQAEDRAHRIGQQDSVLCYYLVSSRGADQDIQEALGLKVSQFIGIMGDTAESEEDRLLAQSKAKEHIEKVIERLKEKAALLQDEKPAL